MNGSHSDRQRALLALLARIRQEPSYKRRLALRDELAALVASYNVIDGYEPKHSRRTGKRPREV